MKMKFVFNAGLAALALSAGLFAAAKASEGDPARGQQVYNETCVACHGENGKGAIDGVPDFTRKDGRLAKTDAVLLKNMTEGFQSEGSFMEMPAKGGNPDLTRQDMVDTLAYLRQAFGK
ncbi:MAG: c-type cytochrome [Pseudomonadota bacterium]